MRNDLLGRFDVSPEGFAEITNVVVRLANESAQGRIVSMLEGGYRPSRERFLERRHDRFTPTMRNNKRYLWHIYSRSTVAAH